MDETMEQYNGSKEEMRNAIDAFGADFIRCANDVEAQLKSDVRIVESKFENGQIEDYDDFFYETLFRHVTTLTCANAGLLELVKRNRKLAEESTDWLARLHEAKHEARAAKREMLSSTANKPEPTRDQTERK
jgi:hypothetical protein